MERVTFLIEATGERLGCLLNPNTLIMRRSAGVRSMSPSIGQLSGNGIADDPVLHTGGGRTELELDLLFDVALAGSTITTDDVRDLTRPLWNLTENALQPASPFRQPPIVRFVWGKAWNVPSVIVAIAERLEEFAPSGAAQRSWVRMRLIRVPETTATEGNLIDTPAVAPITSETLGESYAVIIENSGPRDLFHEVIGGGPEPDALLDDTDEPPPGTAERIDEIAARYYGDPAYWRLIALANDIDDPTELPAGGLIRVPPPPSAPTNKPSSKTNPTTSSTTSDTPGSMPDSTPE